MLRSVSRSQYSGVFYTEELSGQRHSQARVYISQGFPCWELGPSVEMRAGGAQINKEMLGAPS